MFFHSIEVTLLGIMIFFRLVQFLNALPPIEETLLGIWISISPLQLPNAYSLINVDPSDNVIFRFSQSEKRELSKRFPDMVMERSALFLKTWLPIEVTVSGIVIVRWEQYSNARTPIDWILSGITMLRNETQPLNVALFIAVIFSVYLFSESLVQSEKYTFPYES